MTKEEIAERLYTKQEVLNCLERMRADLIYCKDGIRFVDLEYYLNPEIR